jgi:hypothetical protein
MSKFIVSFLPGASGRFIANMIWMLAQNKHSDISIDQYNSVHDSVPYNVSWNRVSKHKGTANEFLDFKFNLRVTDSNPSGIGIMLTHQYPDWEIIRSQSEFDNCKIVVVSIAPDDFPEVTVNKFFKNIVSNLKNPHSLNKLELDQFKKINFSNISDTVLKRVVNEISENAAQHGYANKFIDCPIPDDFQSKTLIIGYQDIYNVSAGGAFTALDKLSAFTGHGVSDQIIQSYKKYVNGRVNFLRKYSSWILENET